MISASSVCGRRPGGKSRMTRERPVRIREGGGVRFLSATRLIIGFQHEVDARRFLDEMRERLKEFALTLHPEKTRLITFGRLAAAQRAKLGLGKPETFDFLGFTHICGRTRQGRFQIRRKSRRDRRSAKLREIKDELRQRILQPIPEQGWFSLATMPTTPCRPTLGRLARSVIMSSGFGGGRCGAAARSTR